MRSDGAPGRPTSSRGVLSRVSRYWQTVRFLRPVQIYGRLAHRVSRPRPDLRAAPALRSATGRWVAPAEHAPNMLGAERFRFLNEERDLGSSGWNDPSIDRLWRYNLHYFDDLVARAATERSAWHVTLIERWIRDNGPGAPTAWEPYPTSLRIVNWIKWALNGGELSAQAVHSLAVQTRWLARRIEHHLLGNHLFVNAKALVFAGLFFEGAEADTWRATGLRLLLREIPEQILTDGGHFERSTMYHLLALEDMLDLLNVARAFPTPETAGLTAAIAGSLPAMRAWSLAMTHPDGEIAFFNDAAIGIAPNAAALDAYAERLGLTPVAEPETVRLAASGYVRIQRGPMVALLDVAPVGPDYLPAHAHADTLSFELSLFGQRIIVNSGTSRYGDGDERLRQRGTAAHNTVIVDGVDSSEVWGGFRVARRARPVDLAIDASDAVAVTCAHDGYRRLPGRVMHTREWRASDTKLEVRDRLTGTFAHAEARFHLHPAIAIARAQSGADGGVFDLTLPTGQLVRLTVEGGPVRVEATTWHPEFGRSDATVSIAASFAGPSLATRLEWSVRG